MAHLIDRDALVAEIEGERKFYLDKEEYDFGWNNALNKILSLLDTIEVKEVDLNREIEKEIETRWRGEYLFTTKFKESAKHFFELGLNAQKGE